jgi:hypothetical protein
MMLSFMHQLLSNGFWKRKLLQDVVKHQVTWAQQRMKHHADKHKHEKVFEVGDKVYLRLQPYIQSSVAPRGNQKLSYHYFGLFSILARIGQVAYCLDLPDICCIHPVVHVSLLKRHIPPQVIVEEDIGSHDDPVIVIQPMHFSHLE